MSSGLIVHAEKCRAADIKGGIGLEIRLEAAVPPNFMADCRQFSVTLYFILIVITLLPLKEMLFKKGHRVFVPVELRLASYGCS